MKLIDLNFKQVETVQMIPLRILPTVVAVCMDKWVQFWNESLTERFGLRRDDKTFNLTDNNIQIAIHNFYLAAHVVYRFVRYFAWELVGSRGEPGNQIER